MTRIPPFPHSAQVPGPTASSLGKRHARSAVVLKRLGAGLLSTVLMAVASFAAAQYGLAFLAQPGGVAVFWPASGIAVGALLVFGRASVAPVACGVAAGTLVANVIGGRPLLELAVPFAIANSVECVTVAALSEKLLGPNLRFDTLKRFIGIFFVATIGAALGAVIGALAISALGKADGSFLTHWHQWLRSDLIGIIAITPLALGLRALTSEQIPVRTHVEGVLLILLVSAAAAATYPNTLLRQAVDITLPISVLFPLLLLLAIRHPLTYSQIGASMVASILVACVVSERGLATDSDIMWAQLSIVSMVACSLSLAALIAERNAGEVRRQLLVRELDHRVKNGLTLVQAVVDRSREHASSIDDFCDKLGGRIHALARTHTMLSREKWQGIELGQVIATELASYQEINSKAFVGPRVLLQPALAQSLSLVVHELATNAIKHGSLARPEGRVHVAWHIEPAHENADGIEHLVIEWQEFGLPFVGKIGPAGFGTSTIRDLLKYEADASVDLSFPSEGARCTIRVPMARIMS
jgi:two-component sensor histidine kinase/integral membrane sensor domain MASE1